MLKAPTVGFKLDLCVLCDLIEDFACAMFTLHLAPEVCLLYYISMSVAVVTGASRGLGREIAMALSNHGYSVAVNYQHSKIEADTLLHEIGAAAMSVKADVGDPIQVRDMADIVNKKWGRIDALINNAGISRDGLLIKYNEADWDEVLRVNLKSCFNTIRAFAPLMIESGGGHIINIASASGLKGKTGQAAYAASKAALIGLTYTMAKELGEYNIRVNAILPGYMPTAMGGEAEKAMEEASEGSTLKRLSTPSEAAAFISSFITTSGITGQIFRLDSRV